MGKMSVTFGDNNVERVEYFLERLFKSIDDYEEKNKNKIRTLITLKTENLKTGAVAVLNKEGIELLDKGYFDKNDHVSITFDLKGADGKYIKKYIKEITSKMFKDERELFEM